MRLSVFQNGFAIDSAWRHASAVSASVRFSCQLAGRHLNLNEKPLPLNWTSLDDFEKESQRHHVLIVDGSFHCMIPVFFLFAHKSINP